MTLTARRPHHRWPAHPAVSGSAGFLVWAGALLLSHPGLAGPGEPGMTMSSWAFLVGCASIGLTIAYGLGQWAWSGPTTRLGATSVVLAVASVLVVWAPWSGWPHVFGATAMGLVVEHRRREGSRTAANTLAGVLSSSAVIVATLLCLFT